MNSQETTILLGVIREANKLLQPNNLHIGIAFMGYEHN